MLARSQLRAAVDAASLAGASGLSVSPTEARNRAKAIALANPVNGVPLTLLDSDIEMGSWNTYTRQFTLLTGSNESKATAMRITARLNQARGSQLNLIFAKMLGQNYIELEDSSIGGFASGMDVVLVQDVSGSFSDELSDAKAGDQALLNAIYNAGGKGGMGLVAFSGDVRTIASLKTVYNNYTSLTNSISSLKLAGNWGMPQVNGTDPAAGIERAMDVFDAFTTPSPGGKAMIIVSDGEPSSSGWGGTHPYLSSSQLLTLAQQRADEAWAEGIHIYVVFYNESNSSSAAAKLDSLKRGKGVFVQVTYASQLPAAMEAITKKLPLQLCK
jgi:hypothetical protein